MLGISGICRSYHRQIILEGVELTVEPRDCVGIVGHNGCGKTTLLSITSGALKADEGSIVFNGRQTVGHPRAFAREATYVPQRDPLMEELTVRNNLLLWYRRSRKGMEEDLENRAAVILGVDKILNRTAGKLLGGVKERVSITYALSNYAPILIIDEPGATLDLEYKRLIRNHLRRYMTGGGAMVLTSHGLVELALCAQARVLRRGHLAKIESGLSANELISQFRQKCNRTCRICVDPMQGRRKRMGHTKCGAECGDEVKFCTQRDAPLNSESRETEAETAGETGTETAEEAARGTEIIEEITGETVARTIGEAATQGADSGQTLAAKDQLSTAEDQTVQSADTQPVQTSAGEPGPNKKFMKILFMITVIASVAAAVILTYVKIMAKDPRQVVIGAFGNIYKDGQVFPSEESFGLKDFADTALKEDRENGTTLKIDSCSDPGVNAFAGNGLRLEGRENGTNSRNVFDMGVIYDRMDPTNFDAYYGDNALMMAIPELSNKILTVDLGEGLAGRIRNSPTIGLMLADSGVDVDGLAGYFADLIGEVEKAEEKGKAPFDIEALMNHYKEGYKTQDNFKTALTITKAGEGTYTMNNVQVSCQRYDVAVSKNSMIELLYTSSDFFLQDETLRDDYLKQLEVTVGTGRLMSGAVTGAGSVSAREMWEQTYDEVEETVDEMITYLEESLTDVQTTVYVDESGNLTAVDGSTNLYVEDGPGVEDGYMATNPKLELQGGVYLMQNLTSSVVLEDATDTVTAGLLKQGTYDDKKLTCGLSVDIGLPEDTSYNFMCTGAYDSADGSHHAGVEVGGGGSRILRISAIGVMGQLEKGKNFHMDIDSPEIAAMDNTTNVVLSGEAYSKPLGNEAMPLKGKPLDVSAAMEQGWNNVLMEVIFSVIGLAGQPDVPIY